MNLYKYSLTFDILMLVHVNVAKVTKNRVISISLIETKVPIDHSIINITENTLI